MESFTKGFRTGIAIVEREKNKSCNLQSFLHQNILKQAGQNQMVLLQHH